tara:strand:- start:820 stop:1119 length:300 start_codon:yes stop_codon:yes gene_type:complete
MKTDVNFYTFRNWFNTNRPNDFSYNGLQALWDMLEEYEDSTGEEIEFDPIALCCEYDEYDNIEEFHKTYDKEDYPDIESIQDNTMVWEFGTESFIIQSF